MDTSSIFCGLSLGNPIVVGSSPLTFNPKGVKKCADAGAGAVVLKSLFEEQIRQQTADLSAWLSQETSFHAEVYEYLQAEVNMRYGTRDYLHTIRECKDTVGIPVFASINCVSDEWWIDFAQEVEAAGADGLELNIALMPKTLNETATDIEQRYSNIVSEARAAVSIPLAVKLGSAFTCLPETLRRLKTNGADGFVLFNRFYHPSIDVDRQEVVQGDRYSTSTELCETLRWIALLADRVPGDFAATTGVHTGDDLVRVLLAGARAAQVVSTVHQNGVDQIKVLLDFLSNWMEEKGYKTIEDVRGRLSQARNPDTDLFTRQQYMEALGSKLE